MENVLCLQTSMSVVGHPSHFSDGLLVGCSFLKDCEISAWYIGRETTESQCFGLLGSNKWKSTAELNNSDLLKTEIAYNTSTFNDSRP